MRKLILVGLLAFAVALVGTAYAEVQNVKVSGDIDMKVIAQDNFDLKNKQLNIALGTSTVPVVSNDDGASIFLSTVNVNLDADLSDNVSTEVTLRNQRIWDGQSSAVTRAVIKHAYVVLKEFLYSPLTLKIGRQELNYGTGFIVGAGLLADPEAVFSTGVTTGPHGQIGQQYSDFNSYDAIRAILDFAPWTIEGVYAKINETGVASDDQDLFGALVNYKVGRWDAEVEPYWFYKQNESAAAWTLSDQTGRTYTTNDVHTVGLRGAASPIENLKINGEIAHQFGKIIATTPRVERTRNAWGATADVRYTWSKVRWTPVTGLGWVFFSGQNPVPNGTGLSDADVRSYTAWDHMYRGSFATYIQDFLGGNDEVNLYVTADANDTAANTNRHLFYGDASVKPLEDLTVWGRYTHAQFARAPRTGRSTYAGDEVDWKVVYDYTGDVKLSLFGGLFLPGKFYDQPPTAVKSHDTAWTVGSGATVKF